MTTYVRFRSEISVGGDLTSIAFWDRAKHSKVLGLEEKGNWIVLTYQEGTNKGVRIRVPMHNVEYIRETPEEKKP